MISSAGRRDLIERLHYTFTTSDYEEIDTLIAGLVRKSNFMQLCHEFFEGCRVDSSGTLVTEGFFRDGSGSASLMYAMYEILGKAPDSFPLKRQVTRIKLARKELSGMFRLPGGVLELPSLRVLAIRGIGISRFPAPGAAADSLKVLDLSGNRFKTIPPSITKFRNLAALNLSYNKITQLPVTFSQLKRLRAINLRCNGISQMPDFWYYLKDLRILDLSINRISVIPENLKMPESLKDLRLSYNELPASEEAMWEKKVCSNC